MNHLYETNGVIHACESGQIHPGILLVWTKCEIDVPANRSFRSDEQPNCSACVKNEQTPVAKPET